MATGAVATLGVGMLFNTVAYATTGATVGGSAVQSGAGGGAAGGSPGVNYLGAMTSFGQSVLNGSRQLGESRYNTQMSDMNNYHTMQQGVYNRRVSNKEAKLIKQDAEMKLATMRRELYRRNHSVSGHKGVRLDSGSVVDVHEDTIRQAAYDAEIVKYQAEVNSNRMVDRGDMSLWSARSNVILNNNREQEAINKSNASIGSSLISQGANLAGGLLS
ncbi:hypothetical protein [Maridesulfovibrio sp.]|uniref:hypothetical protein n=1 Tax=Maridesulfovibrio sp. TaxID=2795000 RepID=UPI0029C9FB85|nr:hypothetical protein [Maridesulfovibrio sp.]